MLVTHWYHGINVDSLTSTASSYTASMGITYLQSHLYQPSSFVLAHMFSKPGWMPLIRPLIAHHSWSQPLESYRSRKRQSTLSSARVPTEANCRNCTKGTKTYRARGLQLIKRGRHLGTTYRNANLSVLCSRGRLRGRFSRSVRLLLRRWRWRIVLCPDEMEDGWRWTPEAGAVVHINLTSTEVASSLWLVGSLSSSQSLPLFPWWGWAPSQA